MFKLQTVLFSLIVASLIAQDPNILFSTNPQTFLIYNTTNVNLVKIASDETLIIVAYKNGTILTTDMNGNNGVSYTTGTKSTIFNQIDYFPGYIFTLDSGVNLNIWKTSNTSFLVSHTFPSSVTGIAWTQSSNLIYGGVNFGGNITNYIFNGTAFYATTTTFTISGSTFTAAMYSSDSKWLIVGTNGLSIRYFNSSTTLSSNSLNSSATVTQFVNINNGNMAALTSNYNVIQFSPNSSFVNANFGNVSSTTAFAGCPSGYVATGQSNSNNVNIYNSNGNQVQQLTYAKNTIISADCSTNYLVALDSGGNVSIYYYINYSKLAAWIIAIIVVFSVLICVGIGLVIFCCVRRRRALAL